ncbi:hypothetical protein LOCC1_G002691 [Lachnellula occidentalis]|uniref:Uncharacterized protein n=1 Tax=Lachnellula occidentalis TaxID=215460 RepID=A0A8H8S535_9HELO|nr:hypothetical protein LOCC1_G002691 [Lachnellula occidentalis]
MDSIKDNSLEEPFIWRDENTGKLHIVESGDVFDKLSSELGGHGKGQRQLLHWFCCKCKMGPMAAEDADTLALFDSEGSCAEKDCSHVKCEDCVLAEGTEDKNGNISWSETVSGISGKYDVNGLSLSERELFKNIPMGDDTQFGHWGEVLQPELQGCPSTPGLTISSAGSPEYDHEIPDQQHMVPECLDELIKIKKAELNLKLPSVWRKRQDRAVMNTVLDQHEGDFISLLRDPQDFLLVWHHTILPFLAEFVPRWCGPSYTIGIRRGIRPHSRLISIMTEDKWNDTREENIRGHVLDLLPPVFHETTGFNFETGSIERLASSTRTTESPLDPICGTKNPYFYIRPTMGDSVGVALGQGDDHSTSTLGPCIMIGKQPCWLVNLHPLKDALKSNAHDCPLFLEHPSPDDRKDCETANHSCMAEPRPNFTLGNIIATSEESTRTRTSKSSYWEEAFIAPPEVIMDWALCAAIMPTTNFIRYPSQSSHEKERPVLNAMHPAGGAPVCSTGRTSGYQRGQIGMCPDLVSKRITGASEDTMEWFVEEPYPYSNAEHFTASGIGVSGDSGAAIIHADNDSFIGQLWGRNKYTSKEPGPRIVYFTPTQDIFDDIREQCSLSDSENPQLPQLDDGSYLPSSNIACDACLLQRKRVCCEDVPSSPEMDFEDMTPPEDELLTPEDIRSPDMRRKHDIEFCHTGFSSSVDSWEEEEQNRGKGSVVDDVYSIARHCISESLHLDSDVSIDFQTERPWKRKARENAKPGQTKKQAICR